MLLNNNIKPSLQKIKSVDAVIGHLQYLQVCLNMSKQARLTLCVYVEVLFSKSFVFKSMVMLKRVKHLVFRPI